VDNNCLQEENNFKYLGCEIYYENKEVIQQKLPKFGKILEFYTTHLNQHRFRIFQQ